jgi:23S rRNA pseudouridine2605 synthase
MTLAELVEEREKLWSRPVRTLDDAREFVTSVGFCLRYPVRPAVLAPTFIAAFLGPGADLPTAKFAPLDPRTRDAGELISRLLGERSALEVNFGDRGSLLVAAAEFPYFYALIGDRNPKLPPQLGVHSEKTLIAHTFAELQKSPASEPELLDRLGKSISEAALQRSLHALWSQLRVVRHPLGAGFRWEVIYEWVPDLVRKGIQLSSGAALSALVSRYLGTVVAAEPKEIEEFFGPLTARSKVLDIVKILTAAREVETVQIQDKRMVRIALPAAPMQHSAGQAPPDLHASHQQNERRRHAPRPPRRVPGR